MPSLFSNVFPDIIVVCIVCGIIAFNVWVKLLTYCKNGKDFHYANVCKTLSMTTYKRKNLTSNETKDIVFQFIAGVLF